MSERIKFSIIVPVYNGASYLRRCHKCISAQTYGNWELLYVDDGSRDESWEIIQSFMSIDNRIKGIHQNNEGPGNARNNGLRHATGDYVVFVDVDDYIDKDYLELLEPLARLNDIVFIDVNQVDLNGNVVKEEKMSIYSLMTKDKILRGMMTGKIPWGGVRKSVSLSLLRKHNICYSDLSIGEEALFSFQALFYSQRIAFLSKKPVYMYEQHVDSQSNLKMEDPWGGTYEAIRNYVFENGIEKVYGDTLNAFNISSTIVSIDRIVQMYPSKERHRKVKGRYLIYKERFNQGYGIDYKSLPLKAKVFIPFLKIGFVSPIVIASELRALIKKEKR